MEFIATLAGLLLATQLVAHLCRRVEIPEVIGQILVGIVAGPALLNWVHLNSMMNEFQEIGVIILMFIAGLESDLSLLKKYLKPAVIVAIIGVIVPIVLMAPASYFFGFTPLESMFIGVIFSATSVSISVAVLREFKRLDSREGATILGAAVADDIIGVILLSIMISVVNQAEGKTGGQPLWMILLLQVLFFGGTYLVVKWLAPYLMHLSERLLTVASPSVMAMIICLGMAAIADYVGLSGAVGSFFAGIAVGSTHRKETINRSFIPIGYAMFIPLFFVSVGLNMRVDRLSESIIFVIVMTILACLTKLVGCGAGAYISGFDFDSSYVVGSGMIARGEMALITAQIGYQAHLLSPMYYSDVITVIIVATVLAPFILKHSLVKAREITA
ncbi:cation:proton antiporter [Limosilactobacillus fastidiosus]|uniref:Cation:proton antiporter n=1 Tax=Limosilactobacillus fastidiosus TaxID=2759855 RepID=A0A7W3U0E6_9LACO|nr:cation:proton antiporter [Limosilactobacillus fastidiosus]MBB1086621.1 cation:proton antiporter [Limosilactobacillus fastidiosus]MCD7086596.1 cation:proton antiporter [Limosilactobacillus fastidiosus]MCD7115304.1 cation:proton antiporter [Limosilactobacillus fastidiosus]MCD7116961.1 cation:proton antiporter [Limosilactobacillus fastidiosus]